MNNLLNVLVTCTILVTMAGCQVKSDVNSIAPKPQDTHRNYYPKNSKQYQFINSLKKDEFAPDDPAAQVGDYIRRIYQTSNGDLWFGTNSFGIGHYNKAYLTYYNQTNGLPGNQVTAILETKDKKLWIATNGGLACLIDGTFKQIILERTADNQNIWSLMEDRDGSLWIGSINGLYRMKNDHITPITLPKTEVENPNPRFSLKLIRAMIQDSNGSYWYAIDGGGVMKYEGKSYTNFTKNNGLCDNNIVSILEDKKGQIWFGSMYGGLCKYNGLSFTTYSESTGDIANNEVWTVYEDSKGIIWFSSEGHGIYKLENDKISNFSEKNGLKVKAVQSIYEDQQGKIWVGGGGGLYMMLGGNQFLNVQKNGPWDPC